MSIERETLMAYADGELDEIARRRVEKAMAADPAIAAEVERHKALRERLRAHFAPVGEAPVPEALAAMLRGPAQVVDLAAVREAKAAPKPVARRPMWWATGAVAAAITLAVVAGQFFRPGTPGSEVAATGEIARALDTQLASNQPANAPVRMLVSFRDAKGTYCRAFEAQAQSGVACKQDGAWQYRELRATEGKAATEYRQAGSAEVMQAAQAMMAGEPLDAAGERDAAGKGWK